jgi:uncharacterized protein (DUF362 family)
LEFPALAEGKPVVSVVKSSSIEAAVRKAVELVGGMEGRVKKWDRILIKVSLDEAKPSGSGEVTNVEVVRALVHMCKEAGARRITIADGSIKTNTWKAFEAAGYNQMAKQEGVILKDLDADYIWRAWLEDGKGYKKYSVATSVLNCEVFINVPVIKIEDKNSPSLSLKNLVGIMCDKRWKRRLKPGEELDNIIIDMNSIRQSDLVVIDGTNNDNMIIAGNDPVSTDSVAIKLLHLDPTKIGYLKMAESKGFGTSNLSEIEVKSEKL